MALGLRGRSSGGRRLPALRCGVHPRSPPGGAESLLSTLSWGPNRSQLLSRGLLMPAAHTGIGTARGRPEAVGCALGGAFGDPAETPCCMDGASKGRLRRARGVQAVRPGTTWGQRGSGRDAMETMRPTLRAPHGRAAPALEGVHPLCHLKSFRLGCPPRPPLCPGSHMKG